jgi:hypothetical protein
MEGWIKLHRSLIDWEWYQDANARSLFMHLLLMANHDDGKWKGQIIKRGQRLTSLKHLSAETGISIQSLRTSISKLKSTHEITHESTHSFTLITICNYETYQSRKGDTNTGSNTQTNMPPTCDQHATNNKQECKKEKREETDTKLSTEIGISDECEGIDFIWSNTTKTKREKIKGTVLRSFCRFWNLWGVTSDQTKTMMVWLDSGWRKGEDTHNIDLFKSILSAAEAYTSGRGSKKHPMRWLKSEDWKPKGAIDPLHKEVVLCLQEKMEVPHRDSVEVKAWDKAKQHVTREGAVLMQWFYSLPKSKNNDPTWSRRNTVEVLLNNWVTQIGLAEAMKSGAKQQINSGREIATEPKKWD